MSKRAVRNIFSDVGGPGLSWEYTDPKTGEVKRKISRTKQADKKSCDINFILDRYAKTGQLPEMIKRNPRYGDFSAVPDFQESCDVVQKATEQFEALDAKVRKRFHNNPAEMLEFAADPANAEEMVRLGMAVKREEPAEEVQPMKSVKASKASASKTPEVKAEGSDQ